jgi:hypothetical protein
MADGLAGAGFWVFLGLIVAASIVAGAIKERDKEREKQAMLRALLNKEGNSVTEVLAYMREQDAAAAAQAARERASLGKIWRWLKAFALGLLVFGAGLFAFGVVVRLTGSPGPLPLVAMLGIWAAGFFIVRWMWRSGKQKNDAHAGA